MSAGMTESSAVRVLNARAAAVERTPITFTADSRQFTLSASQLGVEADWRAAVHEAAAEGNGFGPVRGFRRLRARLFGISVTPPIESYDAAVRYKLAQIADVIDRKGVDAKLVRKGLDIQVVESMSGRQLDRTAAAATIVAALARFDRDTPVALPVVTADPKVNSDDLEAAADAGAHRSLRAAAALLRRDALAGAALADRAAARVARPAAARPSRSRAGRPSSTSSGSRPRSRASQRMRTSRSPRRGRS